MKRLVLAAIVSLAAAASVIAGPPDAPRIVDLAARGQTPGRTGGELHMLLPREKDVRLMNVWGYARLVAYAPDLTLAPDILESIDVEADRAFTMHLRAGHRWSDGAPFTAEDFRYFWEDIATNAELSPGGPPVELLVEGKPPKVEIVDERTVRYSWDAPNPAFLESLAQARDPFIYRPAHYLKQFHAKYGDAAAIAERVKTEGVSSWAALHNRMDSMYNADNPAMPTLQPWMQTTAMPAQRFVFERNPYFHRVDAAGVQLPYIDRVILDVAESRLIAAKTAAGDSELQARGLNFRDVTALKAGEGRGSYETYLWPNAKGSELALYPNLNANDPVWRALLRETRFRVALSLGIDRAEINQTLYFGLGQEAGNFVLAKSPLYDEALAHRNAAYEPERANALLDELGLTARDPAGMRLLPDGRPLQIIVETAGENEEEGDILALIEAQWKKIGVALYVKPSERTVLRNRVYAGETVMAVWTGWDNGIPSPVMSPAELAPTRQETFSWPKWGQYFATRGAAGEAPDLPAAQSLLTLYEAWRSAPDAATRESVWRQMLEIHAAEQFIIGTVAGVSQPIAVSRALRNVPKDGVYSWDPGAQFGMYGMDAFWLER